MNKYYLLKNYIDSNRSLYPSKPDAYLESELPSELINKAQLHKEYLYRADQVTVSVSEPEGRSSTVNTTLNDKTPEDTTTVNKDFNLKEVTFTPTKTEEENNNDSRNEDIEDKRIYINDPALTKEELVALKGIGGGYASKVLEARTEKPFTDFEDLNTRVPLRGDGVWDIYPIIFDVDLSLSL